jgi:hypothetical protein
LSPSDQVSKGADYYTRKSQRALARTMSTLANTDVDQLTPEEISLRHSKMNRIAFLKAAFRKRRISTTEKNKQIE